MTFLPRPEDKLISVGDAQLSIIERGSGGVPLLFVHGGGPGGDSWLDFSPVLEYFRDRRVIFLDLPQHGGSSKEPFDEPRWSYHGRHIVGALDALGIDRADLAGSSTGGQAAIAAAANHPGRLRRISCSGTQFSPTHPLITEEQKAIDAKWVDPYFAGEGPTYEKTKVLIEGLEWYDPATLPLERIQARQDGVMKLMDLMAIPGARGQREDLTDKLPLVSSPTLFLFGAQDPFLSAEYAIAMSRAVQYGDVHIMNKASHHLFAERPKDYALVLRSFLDADLDEGDD
jgi:pimeloyl-ACP methyl ester carboxylesterase